MIKILELFAGGRSIGKIAEKMNLECFSVDWKNYPKMNLIADINFLKITDIPFVPDLIWASPDCRTYSVASLGKHRDGVKPLTGYAEYCDETNNHLIELINEWLIINPEMVYFIENPRGMMRKMDFVKNLERKTIWYCQYGDNRAKPTDIFTNSKKWNPRKECSNNNPNCNHIKASRGSKEGTQGLKHSYNRSMIPEQLVYEILMSEIKEQ